jgi:hypothetical protein
VLVADGQARVFRGPPPQTGYGYAKIFGCVLGRRRAYLLGPVPWGATEAVGGVADQKLAGSVVAYGRYREVFAPSETSRLIVVRDLRTGRVLHSAPVATPAPPTGLFVAIVVKSDGAVAWIVETGYVDDFQVHAVDRNGSRVLAVGSDIEPHSLALAGSTVSWTQGGKPMSAPLN